MNKPNKLEKFYKNWKTTLGGGMVAAGTILQASELPKVRLAGLILTASAALFFGYHAADK